MEIRGLLNLIKKEDFVKKLTESTKEMFKEKSKRPPISKKAKSILDTINNSDFRELGKSMIKLCEVLTNESILPFYNEEKGEGVYEAIQYACFVCIDNDFLEEGETFMISDLVYAISIDKEGMEYERELEEYRKEYIREATEEEIRSFVDSLYKTI